VSYPALSRREIKKDSQREAKPLLHTIPPPFQREGDKEGGFLNIKGVNSENISCWGWGQGAYLSLEASPEP